MADRFPSLEEFDDAPPATSTGGADGEDDFLAREAALLGDDAIHFQTEDPASETAQFDQAFPEIVPEPIPQADVVVPMQFNSGYNTSQPEEETEVQRLWREKRDEANAERAAKFARQREETITEARANIDEFYENYNSKKDKLVQQTRKDAEEFFKNREDTVSGGTSWERIAKLVDISGKGVRGGGKDSGKERFRAMLVSLRKDENAPGASGY